MKGTTFLLLAVLIGTALSPVAVLTVPAVHSGEPALGVLDVCHSTTPAVSAHGEMPFLGLCHGMDIPILTFYFAVQSQLQFPRFILASHVDHPPQA